MPITLLPASAAAFAPRSSCNVVLNSKAEPWLTATLKRVNRIKRPLNNVAQHQRCLTETLSAPTAIWTLCSIMLPKAPDAELRRDDNPLIEALFNFQLLHIEAYVVHVDMVSQNEVAFKLTTDTIDALVEHHKDIFSVDTSAKTWNWPEKEVQLKKLQEDFVQAANRFVFRTAATALEGLEEDGAGELLAGGADEAKVQICGLFQELRPPPPRQPDVLRAAPILPSSTGPEPWWSAPLAAPPPPLDTWRPLPGSPGAVTTAADAGTALWTNMPLEDLQTLPSPPTPAYSPTPSFSTVSFGEPDYFPAAPQPTSVPTSMALESMVPTYPLPNMIAQQCGASAAFGEWSGFDEVDGAVGVNGFGGVGSGFGGGFGSGFGGFDWDRTNAFGAQYALTM